MLRKFIHKFLLMFLDLLILIALFYLALFIRQKIHNDFIPEAQVYSLREFLFIPATIFILLYYERIYTFRYDFWQETHRVFKSLLISFLMVMALLAVMKTSFEYSRLMIVIYFLLATIFLPFFKRKIKQFLYKIDFFKKRVFIVGSSDDAKKLKKEIEDNWYLGQRVVVEGYESVVIVSNSFHKEELGTLIKEYLTNNRELYVVPYITDINFANSNILEYSNIRSSTIHVENKLLISRNIFIKEIFEKLFAFLLMPFLLILHIGFMIAIKRDSKGAALYKQKRLGIDGSTFSCYKYRTMYENSGELLDNYLAKNPDEVKYYEKYHKYKEDPRITKVGKFLRSTSLDELPQFFNIARGDMSLVGPRPYMVEEEDKLGVNKDLILKVKPGITGLWQVSGRNNLTFFERNRLDIWYVRNWSMELDIRIILKTIKVVIYKVGSK